MSRKIAELLVMPRGFENAHHEALMGLMLVSGQQNEKQRKFFKPFGISAQQYNVLRILRGRHPEPCSLNVVKDRLMDKTSDVSRLVERLRGSGYIDRQQNGIDRRLVDISITQQGLDLLLKLDATISEMWQFSNITDAETHQLIELLEKILE